MKDVIIIGNSGAALETYELFYSIMFHSNTYRQEYRFKGFLRHKDYLGCLGQYASLELGSDTDYIPEKDDVFIIAIGSNAIRMDIYDDFKRKNYRFINLISPYCTISGTATIGEANIISLGCHISVDSSIGNCNYLNGEIRVGHHVKIGNGNFFGPRSMAMGNVFIGNMNTIGTTAVLLEHSSIGSNNTITPGSIVFKGCKDNCMMQGNPAIIT